MLYIAKNELWMLPLKVEIFCVCRCLGMEFETKKCQLRQKPSLCWSVHYSWNCFRQSIQRCCLVERWLEQQRYSLSGHIKSPLRPGESADCENTRFVGKKKTYQILCRIHPVAVPHIVRDCPQNTNTTGNAVLELQNDF